MYASVKDMIDVALGLNMVLPQSSDHRLCVCVRVCAPKHVKMRPSLLLPIMAWLNTLPLPDRPNDFVACQHVMISV